MMADAGWWMPLALVAAVVAGWNVRWLHVHRPRLDLLAGVVGSIAIVAFVAGTALFRSQLQLFGLASEVADLALCGALISCWLRSDACKKLAPRPLRFHSARR